MLHFDDIAKRYQIDLESLNHVPNWSGDYRISTTRVDRVLSDFHDQYPTNLVPGVVVDAGCSYGDSAFSLCDLYPDHRVHGIDV